MYIININATPIKIKQVMIHKNVNTASNLWKNLPKPIYLVNSNMAKLFWVRDGQGIMVLNKKALKIIKNEVLAIEQ